MHLSTDPTGGALPLELIEPFASSFALSSSENTRYLLHNRTPTRICIDGGPSLGELVLPPLAERVVTGARLAPFEPQLRLLRQRHQLRVREYQEPDPHSGTLAVLCWLAMLTTGVLAVHAVLVEGTLTRWDMGIAATATLVLVLGTIWRAMHCEAGRKGRADIADRDEGDIEFGVGGAFYDGNETLRRTSHLLTLAGVIAVGAVLPTVAIFAATDAKDFLIMDGGLHVAAGSESRLVGRVIQATYTAVLCLFPAILYFQFDRHRVGTIRGEWVRAIFRVDPRMKTLADVNARYGDQLSEASNYSTDSVRLLGGKNSPIIVATVLVSLGWTLLVARTSSFDFTIAEGEPYFEFLVPTPSAATMAFLGAYFFGVYLLLRSYFRGDLRPKIYNQITARLITVVVLAYLINTLYWEEGGQNRIVWGLSFLAGVVPTTVLQQFGRVGGAVAGSVVDNNKAIAERFDGAFATPRALTLIDGVDIHDSSRLETEGINDIPSLAGGDLVSAMIKTRLPIEVLVDWTDQAVLILLLGDDRMERVDERITRLRRIGIRTASGVVAANALTFGEPARQTVADIVAMAPTLPTRKDESAEGVEAAVEPVVKCDLSSLVLQIEHEPVMRQINAWRQSELGELDHCTTLMVDGTRASRRLRDDGDLDLTRIPAEVSSNGH